MKIVIACGGTGGHIFPGIALAEEFLLLRSDAEIVFVGSPRGLEEGIFSGSKWRLELVEAVSFADKRGWNKVLSLPRFFASVWKCGRLLRREKPDLVFGIGGYASAPVLIAARFLGVSSYAIEPNAVPGLSNRLARFFVREVFVAFDGMEKFFGRKGVKTGVPIRRLIRSRADYFKDTSRRTVLVFGGSQGARKINETILSALPRLADLKDRISWIHQVGRDADCGMAQAEYARFGFEAEVHPFIADMATAYDKADFCVARSGANSVAELLFLKKPSLLIPYPLAAADHQTANARRMVELGIARMIPESELDSEKLAALLREILFSPDGLSRMRSSFGPTNPDFAAALIAKRVFSRV